MDLPVEAADDAIAHLTLGGSDPVSDYAALRSWLELDRELQPHVRLLPAQPLEGQLGAALGMIAVSLGSGGVGVTLARALIEFVRNRRSDMSVTVARADKFVSITASRVVNPQAIEAVLQEINTLLRDTDGAH